MIHDWVLNSWLSNKYTGDANTGDIAIRNLDFNDVDTRDAEHICFSRQLNEESKEGSNTVEISFTNLKRDCGKCKEAKVQRSLLMKALEKQVARRSELENDLKWSTQARYDIHKRLDEVMRKGKAANIAQIAAEERFRRQTEIMEQQTAKISELQQENTMLLLRQRKIQKSTDQADDDELSQVLNGLYQELEGWANRHFPQGDTHAQNSCWIYGAVSCLIFSFYLLKFWIGMSNTEEELIASHKIQSISAEVQKMFPSYIRQHFFAAISKAAVSINNESLRASVDYLAELVESKVGNQSPTCQQKRREQLKTLIWKFVEFKARLECQVNRYMIGQFRPSTSFNEKKMISFGGQSGADIVVDYTLSQALYKLSVDGDPILLLKARVSTRQASEHAKFATNPMYAAERWMNV